MHYKDLSLYEYMVNPENKIVNIGWLENGIHFDIGNFPEKGLVIKYLETLTPVNLCRGIHICDFCSKDCGNGEYHIKFRDKIYASPSLIIHYIREHNYKPPQEYIDAIVNLIFDIKKFYFDSPDNMILKSTEKEMNFEYECPECEHKLDFDKLLSKYGPEGLYDLANKLKNIADQDIQSALTQ